MCLVIAQYTYPQLLHADVQLIVRINTELTYMMMNLWPTLGMLDAATPMSSLLM